MKINIDNLEDLSKTGIYAIRHLPSGRVYIGSTKKAFKQRFIAHKSKLKSGNHNCIYLQRTWDKYGEDSFEFLIIEICDQNIIEREKYYIEQFDACNFRKGFNSNPNPEVPCTFTSRIRNKISESLKEGYKTRRLLPTKGCFKKGQPSGRKGIKVLDTAKFKKPKTITRELRLAWEKTRLRALNRSRVLEIYDSNKIFLFAFRSFADFKEWLKTNQSALPISKGSDLSVGSPARFYKAAKYGKKYRNLYFKFVEESLYEVIRIEKLDEFRES